MARTPGLLPFCRTQWRQNVALEEKLADAGRETRSLRAGNALLRNDRVTARAGHGAMAPDAIASTAAGSVAEWASTLRNSDPLERAARIAVLMASLTPASAPQIAEVFKRLRTEGVECESEQRSFCRAWGRLDGAAALASLKTAEGNHTDSPETIAALAGYAQVSPDKARAWLESLPPGDAATNLAIGLIDGWSLTDFDAAAACAAALPRSNARDHFRKLLLERALAGGGVEAAQRWVAGIAEDDHNQVYKQRAFDDLISLMAARDPSHAAAWITQLGRQEYMTGGALSEVATKLAATSPGDALRWLESLGIGEGDAAKRTMEAYSNVINHWSGEDAAAAGAWLQAQGAHPAYNQMAAAHALRLAVSDIETALAWADSISDVRERSSARDNAARELLNARGDEATQKLAAAGYSDEQMATLRDSGGRGITLFMSSGHPLNAGVTTDVKGGFNLRFETRPPVETNR